jgi:hypothetical protein
MESSIHSTPADPSRKENEAMIRDSIRTRRGRDRVRPAARPAALLRAGVLLAFLLGAASGCGNDDNPASPGDGSDGSELAGTWQASSFVVDGTDGIQQGMSVAITFTVTGSSTLRGAVGTFSVTITNDVLDLCDGASSCTPSGMFEVDAGSVVFDPGTEGELAWQYSVDGSTLSLTTTIEGSLVEVTATQM